MIVADDTALLKHDRRDINADSITFDERDDGKVGDVERVVGVCLDGLTVRWNLYVVVLHGAFRKRRALYRSNAVNTA